MKYRYQWQKGMSTRRDFLGMSALAAAGFSCCGCRTANASAWQGWEKGHFQVHFLYTGAGECMFLIFPDGTTAMIDCGGFAASKRGKLALPILPNEERHAGEWAARYVKRVNPNGDDVDYMLISHFHRDHMGTVQWYSKKLNRGGRDYYLSGFSEAAEFLHFRKAIDRVGGVFDGSELFEPGINRFEYLIECLYGHLKARDGLEVQKFRVGATDQIVPLRGGAEGFSVRNICGNGRVALPDGSIIDTFRPEGKLVKKWNENPLSIGSIFTYGKFRFYTAGDFCGAVVRQDGKLNWVEYHLAKCIDGHVSVAKSNHHAYKCMTDPLVKALQAKVYTACTWDVLHHADDSLARLVDPANQPNAPIIVPGYFPQCRFNEANAKARECFPAQVYNGVHSVIDVPPGGETFKLTLLDARDEDMRIVYERVLKS